MDLNIEYTDAYALVQSEIDVAAYGSQPVPVVRLADVDTLIGTAVMHAQWLVQITDGESDENQDARAFLASPTVQAWRERQKATSETT